MGSDFQYDPKKSWMTNAIQYAFNQGPVVAIMSGILAYFAYAMHYEVPKHIQQINDGYMAIEARNEKQLEKTIESFEKQHSETLRAYEVTTDKIIEAYKGHK